MLADSAPVYLDNFFEIFNTMRAFAVSRSCPSKLAIEAMECMYLLFSKLPRLLEASSEGAGAEHSDPVDDLGFTLIPADNSIHGEKDHDAQLLSEENDIGLPPMIPITSSFALSC